MKVNSIQPFYTKQEVKCEAVSAATSAGLSAGLTLALNKGHNPKQAGKVGLLAGGISLLLGAAQKLIKNHKNKSSQCEQSKAQTSVGCHQG